MSTNPADDVMGGAAHQQGSAYDADDAAGSLNAGPPSRQAASKNSEQLVGHPASALPTITQGETITTTSQNTSVHLNEAADAATPSRTAATAVANAANAAISQANAAPDAPPQANAAPAAHTQAVAALAALTQAVAALAAPPQPVAAPDAFTEAVAAPDALPRAEAALAALTQAVAALTAPPVTGPGWLENLFPNNWKEYLKEGGATPNFEGIQTDLDEENVLRCPDKQHIFNAFWSCPPEKVRVVILLEDPTPVGGVADGLCLSTFPENTLPASTSVKVWKRLVDDKNSGVTGRPIHHNLLSWAKQGVLLVNTYLTRMEGADKVTDDKIWKDFMEQVVTCIARRNRNVAFLFSGNEAKGVGNKMCATLTSSFEPNGYTLKETNQTNWWYSFLVRRRAGSSVAGDAAPPKALDAAPYEQDKHLALFIYHPSRNGQDKGCFSLINAFVQARGWAAAAAEASFCRDDAERADFAIMKVHENSATPVQVADAAAPVVRDLALTAQKRTDDTAAKAEEASKKSSEAAAKAKHAQQVASDAAAKAKSAAEKTFDAAAKAIKAPKAAEAAADVAVEAKHTHQPAAETAAEAPAKAKSAAEDAADAAAIAIKASKAAEAAADVATRAKDAHQAAADTAAGAAAQAKSAAEDAADAAAIAIKASKAAKAAADAAAGAREAAESAAREGDVFAALEVATEGLEWALPCREEAIESWSKFIFDRNGMAAQQRSVIEEPQ